MVMEKCNKDYLLKNKNQSEVDYLMFFFKEKSFTPINKTSFHGSTGKK